MLPFEFVTIQLPLPPRLNVDCSDEELVEWMKKAAWNSIRLDFASSSSERWANSTCASTGGGALLQPAFLRAVGKDKQHLSFPEFVERVRAEYLAAELPDAARLAGEAAALWQRRGKGLGPFVAFAMLRMFVAPLVEGALLMDRFLYARKDLLLRRRQQQQQQQQPSGAGGSPTLTLLPLFDGAISPRMFAIVVLRG